MDIPRRRLRRRMMATGLAVLATIPLPLGTWVSPAVAATGSGWREIAWDAHALDDTCADVLFVAVRGSGEADDLAHNDGMGARITPLRDGIRDAIADSNLDVRQYSVDYPAFAVDGLDDDTSLFGGIVGAAAQVAAGMGENLLPPPYFTSIDIGVMKLNRVLTDSRERCPGERVVLAGYSSGALVVHRALTELTDPVDLAGVALVADPARDLLVEGDLRRQGQTYGSAAEGAGITRWAVALPVFDGFVDKLGIDLPYLSSEVRKVTYDICDLGDPVCAPVDLTSVDDLSKANFAIHGAYGTDSSAATDGPAEHEVGARIAAHLSGRIPGFQPNAGKEVVGRSLQTYDTGYWNAHAIRAAATPEGQLYFGNWSANPLVSIIGDIQLYQPAQTYPFGAAGWGSRDGGRDLARDLALDQFGNVYATYFRLPNSGVINDGAPWVSVYSASGKKRLTFPIEPQIGKHPNTAASIDVDAEGRIYLLARGALYRYAASGVYIDSIPVASDASDLTIDASGTVYVLNGYSLAKPDPTVSRLTADGTWDPVYASLPRGGDNIVSDSRGNLYVGGGAPQSTIVRVDAGDQSITQFAVPEATGSGGYASHLAVAVGADDQVFGVFEQPGESNGNWIFLTLSLGPDAILPFDVAPTPEVSDAYVGEPTSVTVGDWAPSPESIHFQWKLDGQPIPGASDPFYTPSADETGHALSVLVTASGVRRLTTARVSQEVYVQPAIPPDISDKDGDGLLDSWETNGLDVDHDGVIDIDLPAMGASVDHKDLFVEVDWMEKDPTFSLFAGRSVGGVSYAPNLDALKDVSDAFLHKDTRVHIDAGPNSIMNPITGEKWGDRSRANRVPYVENLVPEHGSGDDAYYDWTKFNATKDGNFESARQYVFRYAIYGAHFGVKEGSGWRSSGVAQVSGSPRVGDSFLITQGGWSGGFSRREEAGTFMHELGHTLGLKHGGGDDYQYKPNYLSIMNYSWQMGGRPLDYSSSTPQELYEDALWEGAGLPGADGVFAWYCREPGAPGSNDTPSGYIKRTQTSGPVDWNCDGTIEDVVTADVNADLGTLLTGFDDWDNLKFAGGSVGVLTGADLGAQAPPPQTTPADDPEPALDELQSRDSLADVGDGTVALVGTPILFSGVEDQKIQVNISNLGEAAASYVVSFSGLAGLGDSVTTGTIDGYGSQVVALPVQADELIPGDYSVQARLTRPGDTEVLSQDTLAVTVPHMDDPTVRAQAQDALRRLASPQDGLDESIREAFVAAATPLVDRDSDGVLDDADNCPDVAGPGADGCAAVAGSVRVGGEAAVGTFLEAVTADWPAGAQLSFAWTRDGRLVGSADRYQVQEADAGATLKVTVTAKIDGYADLIAASESVRVPLMRFPDSVPMLVGEAKYGSTISAHLAGWPEGTDLKLQWNRDGSAVSGRTGVSYVIGQDDLDKAITLTVTAAKAGYETRSLTSSPLVANSLALTSTPNPTIAGIARPKHHLTAKVAKWAPVPITLSYQWLRNGATIPGATGLKYKVQAADGGARISFQVTGSKPGYASVSKVSKATKVVPRSKLKASAPTISGTAQVGSTMKARTGKWTVGAKLTFQWFRSGKKITNATGATLALTLLDRTKRITVKVTGTKQGYATVTKISEPTRKVT